MSRIVLGGGISGLSSAYYLSKTFPNQPPVLVEASERLGGWIKSNFINDNLIFEQGPRTIRPGGPLGVNTLSLVDELGISDQILPIRSTEPAARNRMIYVNGQLHRLPSNFSSLFTKQPPFTKSLIAHLIKDLYTPKKSVTDESIYDFTQRRFGNEVADYLISPLICGICAGNAKEISVKFLMEKLFEYEQNYGNISKGIVTSVLTNREKAEPVQGLALKAKTERWSIYSFKKGIETLPKTLGQYIKNQGVDIMLNTNCEKIEFTKNDAVLHFSNGNQLKTSHIISTIPSHNLGQIIIDQHPDLAKLLCDIKRVSVAVINLCYSGNLIKTPAFGFLVPPKENIPLLGVIFDSCCFARSDDTILTVMMGGAWFEELFGKNPKEEMLLQTAKQHIANIIGINDEPTHFKVNILRNCIPQYVVGHTERVKNIQEYIKMKSLPLTVCGVSYFGVGVNDAIMSGKKAIENLRKDLR